MIQIDEFRLPITVQEARDFLQEQTDNFGVFFDVDRCLEIHGLLSLANVTVTQKVRQLLGTPMLSLDNKQGVIEALVNQGVPKSTFVVDGSLALNAPIIDSILNNRNFSPEVHQACEQYGKYTSNKRNMGFLKGLCKLPHSAALSKDNHRMSIGRPKWNILSTSRISASDPGVQGVPRATPEIICEPRGYQLYRVDSEQIEPKINFSYFLPDKVIQRLITEYNDAYYGIMHYCLIPDNAFQAYYDNFDGVFRKAEITDKLKETRQKIKRLTNAGSYGSAHLDDIEPELASAYEKRLIHHPMRVALESKIREQVSRGVSTFYGAFGTPVTPDSTERYTKGDSAWTNHLIRCGINNPVQTTASELMMFSIYEARKILARAKDTHVCFYKHDEACFYISDYDVENGVLEELKEITAYAVKGWIPIGADPVVGVKKGSLPSYIL